MLYNFMDLDIKLCIVISIWRKVEYCGFYYFRLDLADIIQYFATIIVRKMAPILYVWGGKLFSKQNKAVSAIFLYQKKNQASLVEAIVTQNYLLD